MGPYIQRQRTTDEHIQEWVRDQIHCTTCDWWSSSCCQACAVADWELHQTGPVGVRY